MRFFLMIALLSVAACSSPDPERYELKSPCVAIESPHEQSPCVRRRPTANNVS